NDESKVGYRIKNLPTLYNRKARDINDWNTTTYTEYLRDKHREIFGCEYVPVGGRWATEQGMIGRLIGTKAQAGTHDKAIIKRFIDEGFKSYKPTSQYPGTSFGFLYAYRRNIWQSLEAEERREERDKQAEMTAEDYDRLSEWL